MPRVSIAVLTCAVGLAGACLAGAAEPLATQPVEIGWVTKPSDDMFLSFVRPGLIAEVPVKEGQLVKAGQLLCRQDDTAEKEQLKSLQAEAENKVRVDAAEAQLALKDVILKKMAKAREAEAVSEFEYEQARVEAIIAKLSLDLANFEFKQNKGKYDEAKAQVARMKMLAPVDGKVEKLEIHVGECVDAAKPILRFVQIDPLWVDLPVPVGVAAKVRPGQRVPCRYVNQQAASAPAQMGKVLHLADVLDSSGTRKVRVELPNPQHLPAGLKVLVDFAGPADIAPAAGGAEATSRPAASDSKGKTDGSEGK